MISKELLNNKDILHKTITLLSLISLACLATTVYSEKELINIWLSDKKKLYKKVKESQNYCCGGCGKKLKSEQLEIHHKIPKSKGGTNNKSNLIALGTSVKKGGCGCHKKWDREAKKI